MMANPKQNPAAKSPKITGEKSDDKVVPITSKKSFQNKPSEKDLKKEESTAYTSKRSENGLKTANIDEKTSNPDNKKSDKSQNDLKTALLPVGEIGEKVDRECSLLIKRLLSHVKVHKIILSAVQESDSCEAYELFIDGIVAIAGKHRSNKPLNMTKMIKEISEESDELSIRFLTDHVISIVERIQIIKRKDNGDFRWVRHNELVFMFKNKTKKDRVSPPLSPPEEQSVAPQRKDSRGKTLGDTHKDEEAQKKSAPWNLIARMNDSFERKREVRRVVEVRAAMADPYKQVLEDGSIIDVPGALEILSEEDKEKIRLRDVEVARAEIEVETHQAKNLNYQIDTIRSAQEHAAELLRIEQDAQKKNEELKSRESKKRTKQAEELKNNIASGFRILAFIVVIVLVLMAINKFLGGGDSNPQTEPVQAYNYEYQRHD